MVASIGSNKSMHTYVCTYVYTYVVAVKSLTHTTTSLTNPFHACPPELPTDVGQALVVIPFLAAMALDHLLAKEYLAAQTVYSHHNRRTDTLSVHPWSSLLREQLHCSFLITFCEMLPHLCLIVTYKVWIFMQT